MRYITFHKKMQDFPVFSTREIQKRFPEFDARRLVEWQEKGYIQKLRNRYYCFPDSIENEQALFYIANTIYPPSYISLESALAWYGIIPESTFQITACTTRKTHQFSTPQGSFAYRHIKSPLFIGYRIEFWNKHPWKIAGIEKAVIDYLYLHPDVRTVSDLKALRWNVYILQEELDWGTLRQYQNYIDSTALNQRLESFKEFLYARVG